MPRSGFETVIPASERSNIVHALERSATATGNCYRAHKKIKKHILLNDLTIDNHIHLSNLLLIKIKHNFTIYRGFNVTIKLVAILSIYSIITS
jgi:hypothetical protein